MDSNTDKASEGNLFSHFELWPGWLFNIPLVLWWILLSIRYRSVTFPTIADPLLPLGGLRAESKEEMYALLGPEGRKLTAPFVVYQTKESAGNDIEDALHLLKNNDLWFPIVAKPDLGMNGTGVQIVRTEEALREYLGEFPRHAKVILQRLVTDPGEAGVFYVRRPGQEYGRITPVTLKHFPSVTGNGTSTLRELIISDPRANRIAQLYFKRHAAMLSRVPRSGEEVRLVSVGNHVKGARFTNGEKYITKEMTLKFDQLAKELPEFRYGRFDVRYPRIEDLQKGNFTILEYNGAASEPTHIWDKDATLTDAYKAYLSALTDLFVIGNYYRSQGYKPAGVLTTLRAFLYESRVLKTYPQGREG